MKYSAKHIFLIDSIGALLTGTLLSQVLARFEVYFGMPKPILWILAAIAFGFAIYSMLCHLFLKTNFSPFLRMIIYANCAYCFATATLVLIHFNHLTWLGIAYFVGEIIVVALLVAVEMSVLSNTAQNAIM